MLMAILMSALTSVKKHSKKLLCSNNLKQIGISLHSYGSENNSRLPLNPGTDWLWDIAYSTTDYIIATGGNKYTFYCPFDPTKQPGMPHIWQFSQNVAPQTAPGSVPEPQTGRDQHYRVTGYFWMMDTPAGKTFLPQGKPKKQWVTTLACAKASSTELVTDATLSADPDPNHTTFTQVKGGLWNRWAIYDRTNHLIDADTPAGGNIVFVDGHLEWRPFDRMEARFWYPYHWW